MIARLDPDPAGIPPLPGDLSLFGFDDMGMTVIARGDPRDLAAQIMIEAGHDWRRRRGVTTRNFSEAWPKGRGQAR